MNINNISKNKYNKKNHNIGELIIKKLGHGKKYLNMLK